MTEPNAAWRKAAFHMGTRCPDCRIGWWLHPPVKVHNENAFRCIECKRVYQASEIAIPVDAIPEPSHD